MGNEKLRILGEAFSEVIEKLAFMFGEPPDEEIPEVESTCVKAEMSFEGEIAGSVSLTIPVEMGPEIAANVLGIDEDDDMAEEKSLDAIKEVLNVTCGRFLTALAGEEPVFDLSVPQTSILEADQWRGMLNDANCVCYLLDEKPAILCLIIRG